MLASAVFDCINGPNFFFFLTFLLFIPFVMSPVISWASSLLLDVELEHVTCFGQQNNVEATACQLLNLEKHRPWEALVIPTLFLFLCHCRDNMPELVCWLPEKGKGWEAELLQRILSSQTESKAKPLEPPECRCKLSQHQQRHLPSTRCDQQVTSCWHTNA